MEILASARKHGIADDDMLHAVLHYWRHFVTDDPSVTLFIGPSTAAKPLEVAVVRDEDGMAIIHAMGARRKYLARRGDK